MRSTKLAKRAKTHTNAWYRKECVKIAKLISKYEDDYTCVTCGRTAEQGWQMHGSHILPESKFLRMSCEPINIMTQCARCHMDWHENPKGQDWFEKKFPTRLRDILLMVNCYASEVIKPDYKRILCELKDKYQSLIN